MQYRNFEFKKILASVAATWLALGAASAPAQPSGAVQTITGVAANTLYRITENASPVVETLSKVPPVY